MQAKGTCPWQNAGFDPASNGKHPTTAGDACGQGGEGYREHKEASEVPPCVSVIDVTVAITGKSANQEEQCPVPEGP